MRSNPRSRGQAINHAYRFWITRKSVVPDTCDHQVAARYGWQYSGEPTAYQHWLDIPDQFKHKVAKPGDLAFWSGGSSGAGHVAIVARRPGLIFSSDLPVWGRVGRVAVSLPRTKWGLSFLGYADPVFPNAG